MKGYPGDEARQQKAGTHGQSAHFNPGEVRASVSRGFDMNQPMRLSTSRAEGAVLREQLRSPAGGWVRSPPKAQLAREQTNHQR